jgi:hypothetical protein
MAYGRCNLTRVVRGSRYLLRTRHPSLRQVDVRRLLHIILVRLLPMQTAFATV